MTLEAQLERRLEATASRRILWRVAWPIAVAIPALIAWQLYTDYLNNALVPGPVRVAAALPAVLADPNVWTGLASSDLSLLLGFAAAVLVGIPLGLLSGRFRIVDSVIGPLLDLALVTPMIVLMPIVLVALGLTRQAQVVIIFIFSITVVVVPVRAGMLAVQNELIDMARSFGASELKLWREVLLPGSLPSIVTGLRMGFGQANLGMAAVELTMLAIGIGNVLLDLQSQFRKAEVFAVIGIIVVQSMLVMAVLRIVQARVPNTSRAMTAPDLG